MARYKRIDTSPKFLPVVLSEQLLPGTFEHAMNHLLDHEVDLSGLDERFCNEATGALAYPPAVPLKLNAGTVGRSQSKPAKRKDSRYPGTLIEAAGPGSRATGVSEPRTC